MAPNAFAKVSTSLGDEMLILSALNGEESLGRPFRYELDLLSVDPDLALGDVIGQPVTVQIELAHDEYRYIHGLVSRFAMVEHSGRHARYKATLRPWLWMLTRTTNCRIFQHMTVPDVIKKVFREQGYTDFDESLSRPYREWEYLVQYRESSFNFVSRLMEQEGIYYYFKHDDGKHTLFLTDHGAGHKPIDGYEEVPFFPPESTERRERDHIDGWRVTQELQSGRFALNDFDFTKPRAQLLTKLESPESNTSLELYDYPGEYEEEKDGEDYTRVRMEQVYTRYQVAEGEGNARGLAVGCTFSLTGHPRGDQNREYLITKATFSLDTGVFESSTSHASMHVQYRFAFDALDTNTPFRPARTTPKPEITGPQTAIVTGPKGEEIRTDKYGRVTVRFHWDRQPESEDLTSCWVRVAQVWAGASWGAMHIPRIGQEVIVEFLEGDPDRPIITGRVYNATSMPPYDLPQNKTQSGLKSRSTKGGGANNFNELRFEDKLGEEQVYMQAEKNMDTLVKNDQTLTVHGKRDKTVDKDETTIIKQNRSEQVTLNEKIEIGVDRTESVGGNEKIDIVGTRTEHVVGYESIQLDAGRDTTIVGAETRQVAGNVTDTIAGMLMQTAVGGVMISTPATVTISAAGGFTLVAPGGTSTVDSFFTKTGGMNNDAFGFKMSVVGMKTDIAAMAMSLVNNKVDMVAMKVDICRTKFANQQVTIKSAQTAITQGYVNLHTFGLTVIA